MGLWLMRAVVVADLSVMLALMAGRNAKETTEIVQNGKVLPIKWTAVF